ncbi:MAG: enamine deaminase RidA [Rhodospirillaceae bacterium]|jgi:enamine deaminase RidA (YjgF/YER057c/UK114 family)|nr:enamine deaminase RidA [Rhodospirillaceae bacterium]|tara:strand:- start:1131 stop:1520 length:390 start_codon:yes stop_codon:yes gene_type:complete
MLKVHVLDQLHHHRSNVAHGVQVPAGARLLFTNGQVGTKPDGSTPEATAEQVEVIFERLKAVLKAADMTFNDIVRFDVYVTDRADIDPFAEVRDRVMGDHKPGATLLVVNGLARPELKIEIEAVAAKVD